jgi:hypothetical protein
MRRAIALPRPPINGSHDVMTVRSRCPRVDLPDREDRPAAAAAAVHHVELGQARRLPGPVLPAHHLGGDGAHDPARRRDHLAGHQNLETPQPGNTAATPTSPPRRPASSPSMTRPPTWPGRRRSGPRGRPGDLRGRVRAAEPAAPTRARVVPARAPCPSARDLHPHRGSAAHVRRAGPGLRAAVLPVVRDPKTPAGVSRVPPPTACPVPDRAAVRRLRQLLPAPQTRGRGLVRRTWGRVDCSPRPTPHG